MWLLILGPSRCAFSLHAGELGAVHVRSENGLIGSSSIQLTSPAGRPPNKTAPLLPLDAFEELEVRLQFWNAAPVGSVEDEVDPLLNEGFRHGVVEEVDYQGHLLFHAGLVDVF